LSEEQKKKGYKSRKIKDEPRIYVGAMKNNKRDGWGTEYDENGNIRFEGNYFNDTQDGFGTYYYIGPQETPSGKISKVTRIRYEGEWKAGDRHGKGTSYNEYREAVYLGEYTNGLRRGKGVEYWSKGVVKYKGNWRRGLKRGKGVLYARDGSAQYDGEFKNGLIHGYGYEYYPSGALWWYGEHKRDKREGDSVEFRENATLSMNGNFKNGKRSGMCLSYYENGNIEHRGIFKKGAPYGFCEKYNEYGEIITYKNGGLTNQQVQQQMAPQSRFQDEAVEPEVSDILDDQSNIEEEDEDYIFEGAFNPQDILNREKDKTLAADENVNNIAHIDMIINQNIKAEANLKRQTRGKPKKDKDKLSDDSDRSQDDDVFTDAYSKLTKNLETFNFISKIGGTSSGFQMPAHSRKKKQGQAGTSMQGAGKSTGGKAKIGNGVFAGLLTEKSAGINKPTSPLLEKQATVITSCEETDQTVQEIGLFTGIPSKAGHGWVGGRSQSLENIEEKRVEILDDGSGGGDIAVIDEREEEDSVHDL
jgi:antitoxin component YwqK of YwqJK toxin-antitoxin module